MISLIQTVMAKQQYTKISSNVPFVTLYVKYEDSLAKAVQIIDHKPGTALTNEQFESFCNKAKMFIGNKGYSPIEFISIVITSSIPDVRSLATGYENCWIIDRDEAQMIIYDDQPGDFDGIRGSLEQILVQVRPVSDYSKEVEKLKSKAYSDFDDYSVYDRGSSQNRTIIDEMTPINTALVLINIFVFAILTYFGSTENVDYMLKHGAMFVPAIIKRHEYYRFLTCMFLHFGFDHLFGNMLVMFFLGDNIERAVGKIRYLLIYFIGGLIASGGSFLYAYVYDNGIVSAGASGAIFALIGALLWLVILNKGKLEDMTVLRVCIMIGYALYSGARAENIDMAAHLFGLFGGFIVAMCICRKPIDRQ